MSTVMGEESSLEEKALCCESYLLGEKTPRSNDEMIRRYQENVQQFGFSGKTLLYPNNEKYEKKLGEYVSLLKQVVQQKDSLLDVGCGYGSLIGELLPHTICSYEGIDVVPEFIEHAQSIYAGKVDISFHNMDMERYRQQYKRPFDWCVLLGVLNSVPYPNNLIKQAWDTCEKGLLFDINNIEKAGVTRYNTFNIPQYVALFQKRGAKVTSSDVWDGCTILKITK